MSMPVRIMAVGVTLLSPMYLGALRAGTVLAELGEIVGFADLLEALR